MQARSRGGGGGGWCWSMASSRPGGVSNWGGPYCWARSSPGDSHDPVRSTLRSLKAGLSSSQATLYISTASSLMRASWKPRESRRDGKHAFLPQDLETPLRKLSKFVSLIFHDKCPWWPRTINLTCYWTQSKQSVREVRERKVEDEIWRITSPSLSSFHFIYFHSLQFSESFLQTDIYQHQERDEYRHLDNFLLPM